MAYMNIDYTYTKIHTLQLEQNYLFRLYATEELLGVGVVIRVNSQGIEMSIAVVISPLPNFLINQDTTLADILDLMHCVLGREQAHREKDKDTSNKETAHVLGLVGLTPQQQPGSYTEPVMMMMKCQFHWWSKPEHPRETTDLRQVTDKLSHIYIQPLPSPGIELGSQRCEAKTIYHVCHGNLAEVIWIKKDTLA